MTVPANPNLKIVERNVGKFLRVALPDYNGTAGRIPCLDGEFTHFSIGLLLDLSENKSVPHPGDLPSLPCCSSFRVAYLPPPTIDEEAAEKSEMKGGL